MKSLQESLFDNDLVSKDIGVLSIITSYLDNYLDGNTTYSAWNQCLSNIIDNIKFSKDYKKRYYIDLAKSLKIKDDELYVYIGYTWKKLIILSKGVNNMLPDSPALIIIEYNNRLKNIYANIITTDDATYRKKLENETFYRYKVSKDEIKIFIKEILNNIEVF